MTAIHLAAGFAGPWGSAGPWCEAGQEGARRGRSQGSPLNAGPSPGTDPSARGRSRDSSVSAEPSPGAGRAGLRAGARASRRLRGRAGLIGPAGAPCRAALRGAGPAPLRPFGPVRRCRSRPFGHSCFSLPLPAPRRCGWARRSLSLGHPSQSGTYQAK